MFLDSSNKKQVKNTSESKGTNTYTNKSEDKVVWANMIKDTDSFPLPLYNPYCQLTFTFSKGLTSSKYHMQVDYPEGRKVFL